MANHTDDPNGQVVVVMVPFPAQGHINQLLHLSRVISSYHIPIHYVGYTTYNRQAKLRVHGWDPLGDPNVHFHDFPTPPFPSPPPNPNAPTKFPSHLQPSFEASLQLRQPVAQVLANLSPKARRIIVIHDVLMAPTIQDVISIPNAEAYAFQNTSAFFIYSCTWEATGRPSILSSNIMEQVPSLEGCVTEELLQLLSSIKLYHKLNCGNIFNSCRAVEGEYLDLLAKEEVSGSRKLWAVGPLNPVSISAKENYERNKCLEWLDKHEKNSVIFVSFGTTTSLSDEQIHEIAIGLEKSEQKFIWVLRDADKGDVFVGGDRRAELPEGYEQKVEGRGMIVRDWTPQLEILGHLSTGGFMSHCGWNSCMEGITMGVPIAAWPMHSDQPRLAVLITQVLKIGIVVKAWTPKNELVTSSTVENVVRILMASGDGDEMRKRAEDLGGAARRSVEDGGVTRAELDSFVAHITR